MSFGAFGAFGAFAAFAAIAAFAVSASALGCGATAVCRTGGINDASNRTMRRQVLAYGLGEFCKQMLLRSAPLRLSPDAPIVGRFFPTRCDQRQLDNGDLQIDFDGWGYAFMSVAQKVTFTSGGVVEYNQDFRCSDDNAIYAYFPVKSVKSSNFQMHAIGQPLAQFAQGLIQTYADKIGAQMLGGKLSEGFTVIRNSDDSTDFDLGILPLGQRPAHPYRVSGEGKVTYESLRVEVQKEQRDFIGPIRMDHAGALSITLTVEGVPAIDVFVIPKDEADPSLKWYFDYGAATPLATPPRIQGVAQQGLEYRQTVPLPAGSYYVVIDNTSSAGQVAPQSASPATVSYLIQIGDAP